VAQLFSLGGYAQFMKTRTRIELFGACIGLLWALLALYYSGDGNTIQDIAILAIAGITTGILFSLVLWKLLVISNNWVAMCLGLLALPLGVYCFGAITGVCHLIIGFVTGGDHITFSDALFQGRMFVRVTTFDCSHSYLGFVIFPLAAVTAYLLRLTILYKNSSRAST
jgi:hypothetical protein